MQKLGSFGTKMNSEVKQKWIDALRSEEYEQGTKLLHYSNKFCCLGVLCDISNLSKWKNALNGESYYYMHDNTYLPEEVMVYADISFDMTEELARMNDTGYTFNQIADYIEEKF